jgi:excinuclease ABC subunit B
MSSVYERDYMTAPMMLREGTLTFRNQEELDAHIGKLQDQMRAAAANLDFEKAAALRDDIKRLRSADLGLPWPARRN